jgi:hypothetical protein
MKNKERERTQVLSQKYKNPKWVGGYKGAKEQIMFHKHITNAYVHFPSRCKFARRFKGKKNSGSQSLK